MDRSWKNWDLASCHCKLRCMVGAGGRQPAWKGGFLWQQESKSELRGGTWGLQNYKCISCAFKVECLHRDCCIYVGGDPEKLKKQKSKQFPLFCHDVSFSSLIQPPSFHRGEGGQGPDAWFWTLGVAVQRANQWHISPLVFKSIHACMFIQLIFSGMNGKWLLELLGREEGHVPALKSLQMKCKEGDGAAGGEGTQHKLRHSCYSWHTLKPSSQSVACLWYGSFLLYWKAFFPRCSRAFRTPGFHPTSLGIPVLSSFGAFLLPAIIFP